MHLLTGWEGRTGQYWLKVTTYHHFHANFIENVRKDRCQFSMNVKVREPTLNELITYAGWTAFFGPARVNPSDPKRVKAPIHCQQKCVSGAVTSGAIITINKNNVHIKINTMYRVLFQPERTRTS